MLLIDDFLLAPAKLAFFVFREIAKRVDEALADDDKAVEQQLQELYRLLESGKVSEQEFERREQVLVQRLEEMERM